jgi:hypothetical protein
MSIKMWLFEDGCWWFAEGETEDEVLDLMAEAHRKYALASDPEGLMEDARLYAQQVEDGEA